MRGKKLLFVHNNFPGQFDPIAAAAAEAGATCAAIGSPSARDAASVKSLIRWSLKRGTTKDIFPLAVRAEADLLRAQAAAECAVHLREKGFIPDLIIAHPGWGESLFLREIFPDAKQVLYSEYYYHTNGADVGFDPEFSMQDRGELLRVHAKNATLALALSQADRIVCPTAFQASLLPDIYQPRTVIIHEGVDTRRVKRIPKSSVRISNDRDLDGSAPVITFVNRHIEPLRGFHIFMRALPAVLAAVPDAQVLIIGDDRTGYGLAPPPGSTWRAELLREVGARLDLKRVHFLGRISREQLLAAFSISRAHVYYTYPFVLSWSLLEAMACERTIVASDTSPVREVITDGHNGLLLDFFDVTGLSETLINCCRGKQKITALGKAARNTILESWDRERVCLPAWTALLDSVCKSD